MSRHRSVPGLRRLHLAGVETMDERADDERDHHQRHEGDGRDDLRPPWVVRRRDIGRLRRRRVDSRRRRFGLIPVAERTGARIRVDWTPAANTGFSVSHCYSNRCNRRTASFQMNTPSGPMPNAAGATPFARTTLLDPVKRYSVPLLVSKANHCEPRTMTRSTPVGNCEARPPKRPRPRRPRRKPRVTAWVNDCAPSIIHTRFADGSATASVRAVSAVDLEANATSTGTAPT